MKALAIGLSVAGLVGGAWGITGWIGPAPVTEPDAILETQSASLTTYLPTAKSYKQDVRPRVGQRGVQIDGAARAGNAFGLAIQGNPFAHGSGTSNRMGNIRLDTG